MGNSPVTGELPTQKASNVENVSIWWRQHVQLSPYIHSAFIFLLPRWVVYSTGVDAAVFIPEWQMYVLIVASEFPSASVVS